MKGSVRTGSDREEHHHDRTGLARIPAQGGGTTACRHCSVVAPERLFRLMGAWSVIDGTAVWDCDSCTRARLHEIESGVDRDVVPAP
jgi:hypothetical protein